MIYIINLIKMMNLFILFIGLSTMWIFMFKISWLFSYGKAFGYILIYSLLLYSLSFILLRLEFLNHLMIAILKLPLISFAIFKLLHFSFKSMYGRDPENTAWSYEKKSIKDIMFSILFWFLGLGIPILLIATQFPKQP